MKRKERFLLAAVMAFGLAACSGGQVRSDIRMPKGTMIDMSQHSLVQFTVTVPNEFKPEWNPSVYVVTVVDEATGKEYFYKTETAASTSSLLKHVTKGMVTLEKKAVEDVLISLYLPAGSYHLKSIRGGCSRGIGLVFAAAVFDFPFDMPFVVAAGEIVYGGKIEMTNRERVSAEQVPSGGTFPLIDQALAGFSTGTFHVDVIDRYDDDVKRFKEANKILANATIEKRLFPQWTRPSRIAERVPLSGSTESLQEK